MLLALALLCNPASAFAESGSEPPENDAPVAFVSAMPVVGIGFTSGGGTVWTAGLGIGYERMLGNRASWLVGAGGVVYGGQAGSLVGLRATTGPRLWLQAPGAGWFTDAYGGLDHLRRLDPGRRASNTFVVTGLGLGHRWMSPGGLGLSLRAGPGLLLPLTGGNPQLVPDIDLSLDWAF